MANDDMLAVLDGTGIGRGRFVVSQVSRYLTPNEYASSVGQLHSLFRLKTFEPARNVPTIPAVFLCGASSPRRYSPIALRQPSQWRFMLAFT